MQEGKPIPPRGEVVRLKPRAGMPRVCDVEVAYGGDTEGRSGPAQVASKAYRDNWDAVFGARKKAERALS